MAVATFAVLFWFKLPDVSRLFLLILFPTQYVVTLVTRAILRLAFRELRARGRNARYVLVVGAGPRGQAFAATLENHHELGLVEAPEVFAGVAMFPLERCRELLEDIRSRGLGGALSGQLAPDAEVQEGPPVDLLEGLVELVEEKETVKDLLP